MFVGLGSWVFDRSIRSGNPAFRDFPAFARDTLGVDSVELVSTHFESQSAEYLNDLRRKLAAARIGLRSIAVDTGFVYDPDSAVRRTSLEAQKQWLHVGRALGSGAVRFHTGYVSLDDPSALASFVEGYRELLDEAAGCGVKLVIENHEGISHTPAGLRYILDALDAPHFATCPDTGNSEADDWEEVLRLLAPKAHSVHVKLYSHDASGIQSQPRADGSIKRQDLRQAIRYLRDVGFRGQLTYAYTASDADELDAASLGVKYIRQLADESG